MAPKVYFSTGYSSPIYETAISNEEREAIRKSARKFPKKDAYGEYSDSYISQRPVKPKTTKKQDSAFWSTVKRWFWGESKPKAETVKKDSAKEAHLKERQKLSVKKFIKEPTAPDEL